MDNEQYTIPGLTGADVSLPIAGPGSRSYAFVIDWHIRFVLALAWFVGAMLLEFGNLKFPLQTRMQSLSPLLLAFLPPDDHLFLLSPRARAADARPKPRQTHSRGPRGDGERRHPGDRRRVDPVTFSGSIDSLPMLYFVGFATTLLSAQRVRIGDMAAGTLLVIDEHVPSRYLELDGVAGAEAEVDFAGRDLIQQILERWSSLNVDKRDAIARTLLERMLDPAEDLDTLDDAALHARLAALSGRR